jgi:hypothetical protein
MYVLFPTLRPGAAEEDPISGKSAMRVVDIYMVVNTKNELYYNRSYPKLSAVIRSYPQLSAVIPQ